MATPAGWKLIFAMNGAAGSAASGVTVAAKSCRPSRGSTENAGNDPPVVSERTMIPPAPLRRSPATPPPGAVWRAHDPVDVVVYCFDGGWNDPVTSPKPMRGARYPNAARPQSRIAPVGTKV